MEFVRAMVLVLDTATDAELDAAWKAIGASKLSLRRLYYAEDVVWKEIRPAIRAANCRIDAIWNEMMQRQIVPWYYERRRRETNVPRPSWSPHHNFLTHPIPSAFGN